MVDNEDRSERLPGAMFRALADLYRRHEPNTSHRGLARLLHSRLSDTGISYHERSIRRQLTREHATVPRFLENAMQKIVEARLRLDGDGAVEKALNEAGLEVAPEDRAGTHVSVDRVAPLARLWLHLNPDRTKRFLAHRITDDLGGRGVRLGADPLELTLAGKGNLVRREVLEQLLAYLSEQGIADEDQAVERLGGQAEEIDASLSGRELVTTPHFRQLAEIWQRHNGGSSKRRLATLLKEGLAKRRLTYGIHHLQELLHGKRQRGQRRVLATLTDLVATSLPAGTTVDDALESHTGNGQTASADLQWVKAGPIAELARSWLDAHPNMSRRQLALRVTETARRLGYRTSPNTIQPILAGTTTRTRGFVYRAMLAQFADESVMVPEEHILRDDGKRAALDGAA